MPGTAQAATAVKADLESVDWGGDEPEDVRGCSDSEEDAAAKKLELRAGCTLRAGTGHCALCLLSVPRRSFPASGGRSPLARRWGRTGLQGRRLAGRG